MNANIARPFFEYLYSKYNKPEYIGTDPVYFPHNISGNKEFIAFTSALFAYGNVKAIQGFLARFFESCGTDPGSLKPNPAGLKYRFQNAADIAEYTEVIKRIYGTYGSIEAFFTHKGDTNPYNAALTAMEKIKSGYLRQPASHGLSFLLAVPGQSASKRLMMMMRWMVRSDEIDLGLWKSFSTTDLFMPLDTHIHRMSASLGIINSNDNSKTALGKVNAFFKQLSPNDPVRYDFALTRLGIVTGCSYTKNSVCKDCADNKMCVFN